MLSWLDYGAGIEGIAAVLLALFLASRGVRKPATWVLSALILNFGIIALSVEIPRFLLDEGILQGDDIPPAASLTWFVARCLFISLNLAFAVAYPDLALSRTKLALLFASLVPGVALTATILADPALVLPGDGSITFTSRLIAVLVLISPLPALWVFGNHWVKEDFGPYRTQFLYVLIPYLYWNINDGLSYLLRTLANPERIGDLLVYPVVVLSVIQLLLVLRIGAHAAFRARRHAKKAPRSEPNVDLRLVLWLLAGIPLSFLQFAGTGGHAFVDGLVIPIMFYGVAKYQILEIDLALKAGVSRGVIGAAMLVILIGVEQTVQAFAGAALGFTAGIIIAVIVAIAFVPLHRGAEALSERLFPRAKKTESYLEERRLELYRAALEGVLLDRLVDPKEARALSALRVKLDISKKDHDRIEEELRAKSPKPFRKSTVVKV